MKMRTRPIDKITAMMPAPVDWRVVRWCGVVELDKTETIELSVLPVIGWAVIDDEANAGQASDVAAIIGDELRQSNVLDNFVVDDGSGYLQILGYLQPGQVFDETFWMGLAAEELKRQKVRLLES